MHQRDEVLLSACGVAVHQDCLPLGDCHKVELRKVTRVALLDDLMHEEKGGVACQLVLQGGKSKEAKVVLVQTI